MGLQRTDATAILLATVLVGAAAAPARASNPGGSAAGPQAGTTGAAPAGGSEYGALTAPVSLGRPTGGLLSAPATTIAGRPPTVTFRIDEHGASVVLVRVTV